MDLNALNSTQLAWHRKVCAKYFPIRAIENPGPLGTLTYFPSRQPSAEEVFRLFPMPDGWQATDPLPLM